VFRRRQPSPAAAPATDPLGGFEPQWRVAVGEALDSRDRLYALVAQVPEGPLRDRLSSMTARADVAVQTAWDIASRAQGAARLVATLDRDGVEDRLKQTRRRLGGLVVGDPEAARLETEAALLTDQYAALNQLANTVEDANEQLRLLDLRLDAVVAKAAQLVMRPDSMGELAAVEGQLDSAVGELNALGAGLAAVDALSGMP